jgi:hypothetical protein
MGLIIVVAILLLLFGGGGYYGVFHAGNPQVFYGGSGLLGLVLVVLLVMFLLGRL